MQTPIVETQRTKPLLVTIGAVWAAASSLLLIVQLTDRYRLFQSVGQQRFELVGTWWFAFLVLQIVAFLTIAVGIMAKKNWARLSFILLSALVVVVRFASELAVLLSPALEGPPANPFISIYSFRTLLSLDGILLAIWLFNQQAVLNYFHAVDFRPNWLSRRVIGVQLDLALALGLLGLLAAGLAVYWFVASIIDY